MFDGILGRQQGGETPERATPIAAGTPPSLVDDLLVLDYGSEESLALIARYAAELAVVIVDGESHEGPHYIRNPFTQEPDWAVTSINLDLAALQERAMAPEASL